MMNKGHQLRQDLPGLLTKVPRKASGWDAMCATHNGSVGEGRADKPSFSMAYMYSLMRQVFTENFTNIVLVANYSGALILIIRELL